MLTLILVRHGESRANNEKFFAGQLDVELSELGRKQADMTAKYVTEAYKIDKIYSSTLRRAYDTATAIAERTGLDIIPRDDLREINSGKWQGLHFDELEEKYTESYGVWLHDIGNAKTPEGESVKELYERAWSAIEAIAKENPSGTVAVSTHATPIRAIICRLRGYTAENMKNIPWGSNASIAIIEFDGEEWQIKLEGYDDHLATLKTSFPANV